MNPSPAHDPSQAPRPISLLDHIASDKKLASEIEDAHREVTAHMINKRGKGKITLTLDYAPAGDDRGINIVPEINIKLPKKARRAAFIYADNSGKTFIDDPTEPELPFTGPTVHREPDAPRKRAIG